MRGTYLKFFVHESHKYHSLLTYEWLLEQAQKLGIHGGSAYRGIAGFGRHGVIHEEHFFELAGELPVEVVFAVTEEEADRLLALIRSERLSLPFVRLPAEYGVTSER